MSERDKSAKEEFSSNENDAKMDNFADENEGQSSKRSETHDLVRLIKTIVTRKEFLSDFDRNTISPQFYNSFNFPLLDRSQPGVNLTIGVTSANRKEGKTLVVSNLAVSLALAHQRETVVVDLNVRSPHLHEIFGTSLSPGLIESLSHNTIEVSKTSIQHLSVLSAGNLKQLSLNIDPSIIDYKEHPDRTSMGLEHIAAFRDVLYSLKQKFDFVIVDMPSIQEPAIPLAITHQMEGIIVVVSANKTTHRDIQKMFVKVKQNQIIGFVFNRVPSGFLH